VNTYFVIVAASGLACAIMAATQEMWPLR